MNIALFISALAMGVVLPWAALWYLRPILMKVLHALCETGEGVEFWLRAANLLAVTGTLLLLLTFGDFSQHASLASSLRLNLWLVLFGIFSTVAYITISVRRRVPPTLSAAGLQAKMQQR